MSTKVSIRFFDDYEVRAIWDEENSKWWFSVLDVVAVLNGYNDYNKTRSYWKYLKGKLKRENIQLVSDTNQLKLLAADSKRYLTDILDSNGIVELARHFPNNRAMKFIDWSQIGKNDYMNAMIQSPTNSTTLKELLRNALTDDIHSREMFMKGIDYSYYYEEE
jgi:cell filamentation protein